MSEQKPFEKLVERQNGDSGTALVRRSHPPEPTLALFVLGHVRAEVDGRAVKLRSRKARAILGYLALTTRAEETRERLVGLFWSESSEDRARASLRQIVHELREALEAAGCAHLQAERLSIRLDAARTTLDLSTVLAEAEAGHVHDLLLETPRLHDLLLEGLDDLDPAFRLWLLARRQAFHDRLLHTLEPRLRDTAAGEWARQKLVAQAIQRLDPTHEEACRALMRAAAAEGDAMGAQRAYQQLWDLLQADYDVEPSGATQDLYVEIKSGRFRPDLRPPDLIDSASSGPAAGDPAPVPQTLLSLAPSRIALQVEPFSLNGVPPERAHLVAGFRHEMIACLVRFREWFIVDGPSALASDAAVKLSALYRITATAYQAGDRISMLLTLAEQGSGIFIWSERIDLRLENWFEAQQRLLRRIAASLNAQLSTARLMRLAGKPDMSLEAYDRWLRGQAMIFTFGADPEERAISLLRETVERTPHFAPAWSGLAQALNNAHIGRPGVPRDAAREDMALGYARRAVEIDPTDSRAHLALAWCLALADRHPQGETNIELALELNPYDSWTLISAGMFHGFAGDHARAQALAEQSRETTLWPTRTHWIYAGTIAFLAGDYALAAETLDRAEEVICTSQAWRAAALALIGDRAAAREAASRFLATCTARWRGRASPSDDAITAWMLRQSPVRRATDWARLRDGLRRAGLPVNGATHGEWYASAD
jgi:DNA-binding SARP family transcriptional activator/TolB-like protein